MTITKMDLRSYKAVARIALRCFSQPWSEKTYLQELSNPNSRTLVAFVENVAVGFMNVWQVLDEVCINDLAVLEDYRRKGIASALMEQMMREIKTAQCVTLEVRKSNFAALALYEKFGFVKVGQRRDFYSQPTEDAVLMTLSLNGVS